MRRAYRITFNDGTVFDSGPELGKGHAFQSYRMFCEELGIRARTLRDIATFAAIEAA